MKKTRPVIHLILAACLLLCCATTALAAGRLMCSLIEQKSGSVDVYSYRFSKGNVTIAANVINGGSRGDTVTISTPSGCVVESAGKVLAGTVGANSNMTLYSFAAPGDYNLTITAPTQNGTTYYAPYTFSIWSMGNTAGILPTTMTQAPEVTANPMRHVVFAGSSSFTTNIRNKAVVDYATDVKFGSSVTATIAKDGQKAVEYKSGTPLTTPGSYAMIFTSTNNPDITKSLEFTVTEIKKQPKPEDYRYQPPVSPENEFQANIKTDTGDGIIGGWTDGTVAPPLWTDDASDTTLPSISNGITGDNNLGFNTSGGNWLDSSLIQTGGPGGSYDYLDGSTGTNADGTVTATLYETYHQEYDTYEMRFQNKYFYTNASNGSIVSHPVTLDIPKGIVLQLDKDGEIIPVLSQGTLKEYGSYLLTLSYIEEDGVRYKTTYRFRIQKQPEAAASSGSSTPSSSASSTAPAPSGGAIILPGMTQMSDQDVLDAIQSVGNKPISDLATEEELNAYAENLLDGDMGPMYEKLDGLGAFLGMNQSYDTTRNLFRQETLAKTVFYTSVPNGAVVNDSVSMVLDSKIKYIVTRNSQPYEYKAGEGFTEAGIYCVVIDENDIAYSMAASAKPRFTFRILESTVSYMDSYYPPDGYHLGSVLLGDQPVTVSTPYATFTEEGVYHVTTIGDDAAMPALQLQFTLDTTAPVFTFEGTENGVATAPVVSVTYADDDIDRVELYNSGKLVEGFSGYQITDPGDYELFVYDKAGNRSSAMVLLKYKLNLAAIVVVLLMIAVTAGVLFFVKLTRTKIRIR